MKKILRFITQRVVITALLIVLQALLLFGFIWKLDNYFVYFYAGSVPAEPAHHLRHHQQQKQPRLQDRVAHPHPAVPGLWGTCLPAVWLGQDRPLPAQKAAGHRHRDGQRHRRGAPALGRGASCRRTRPTSPATFPTAPTARPIRTPPPSIFRWARSSLSGWWRN